jgi:hypothetical protein
MSTVAGAPDGHVDHYSPKPDGVEHGIQHRVHPGAFERDVGAGLAGEFQHPGRVVLLAGVQHMVRHPAGDRLFLPRLRQFADDRGDAHALEDGTGQQPGGVRPAH